MRHRPPVAVVEEFIVEGAAGLPVGEHEFQFDQTRQVHLELGIAPAQGFAQRPAGEAHCAALDPLGAQALGDQARQFREQAPGLWRQFVEAAPQDLVPQGVGFPDVRRRHLDVFQGAAAGARRLGRALILVQQGNGVDQGEVFLVIAPGAGPVVEEGQPVGAGLQGVVVVVDDLLKEHLVVGIERQPPRHRQAQPVTP